jgi:hypothetical protein
LKWYAIWMNRAEWLDRQIISDYLLKLNFSWSITFAYSPYGNKKKKRERLFRDTTSGLTATRWPMKKQKATVLKIITVVLLVNEMHIKKQARVRCVITIDYHLLSPLIDQFHIHINRPSSAPIFLIFSWENVYIHHSFFSRQY